MFVKIKNILRNFNLKENNRPFIFLVCLLIATVLWFVKALEKQYETTVSIPVKYTELPINKELVNPPPSRFTVKIKAQGFAILRQKFGLTRTPININIKLLNNNSMEKYDSSDFILLPKRYISNISNQISSEIKIIDISPDTIFFHFEKLSKKN